MLRSEENSLTGLCILAGSAFLGSRYTIVPKNGIKLTDRTRADISWTVVDSVTTIAFRAESHFSQLFCSIEFSAKDEAAVRQWAIWRWKEACEVCGSVRRALRPFCAIQLSLLRLPAQWETTCLFSGLPSHLSVVLIYVCQVQSL